MTNPTAPTPPSADASQAAHEDAFLRAVAEAAQLRLEVAALRAENAALKAAPRATDARAATIGACRRVAAAGWTPGCCDTCSAPIPGWAETLDSTIALTSFVAAPMILYRCNACMMKHMAVADAQKAAEALEERRRERVDLLRAAWASMPVGDRELSMRTVGAAKTFDGTPRIADPSRIERVLRVELGPAPKKRILLLRGITGVGKTTLADAWAQDVIRAGESLDATPYAVRRAASVRHVTAAALAGARKRAPLGREAPLVEEAMRASVLVLDELGGESLTDQALIEEVVFDRITAGLTTIITTGLDKEQLGMRYRAGFVRRILLDKSIATSIPMLKSREAEIDGADVLRGP